VALRERTSLQEICGVSQSSIWNNNIGKVFAGNHKGLMMLTPEPSRATKEKGRKIIPALCHIARCKNSSATRPW
jgi:hypothetical protein